MKLITEENKLVGVFKENDYNYILDADFIMALRDLKVGI